MYILSHEVSGIWKKKSNGNVSSQSWNSWNRVPTLVTTTLLIPLQVSFKKFHLEAEGFCTEQPHHGLKISCMYLWLETVQQARKIQENGECLTAKESPSSKITLLLPILFNTEKSPLVSRTLVPWNNYLSISLSSLICSFNDWLAVGKKKCPSFF